jgi:hypothetical protein
LSRGIDSMRLSQTLVRSKLLCLAEVAATIERDTTGLWRRVSSHAAVHVSEAIFQRRSIPLGKRPISPTWGLICSQRRTFMDELEHGRSSELIAPASHAAATSDN